MSYKKYNKDFQKTLNEDSLISEEFLNILLNIKIKISDDKEEILFEPPEISSSNNLYE